MATTSSVSRTNCRSLCCIAGLMLFVWSVKGQYDPDWARHFRIGPMVGLNIKADFEMNGNTPVNHPAGVYDDGYVLVDSTGNGGGATSFWGYQSSSQLNGQTLSMHDTTSFSPSSAASTTKDGGILPGLELAYGGNLWYWKRVRVGWDFGFGFLPISITAGESGVGSANQSTFTFNTSGIVPGAPYNGPFQYPPPGIGGAPLLPATAASTNTTTIQDAQITGSQSLDVMLYTFRLGPSVYWDFNRYVGMSVGAGPALGLVSGDLKFDEFVQTSTIAENKGQVSGTDLVYGWYANATVLYHVMRNGDIYLSGQFMPLGTATISGQGHQGRLDLKGAAVISAGFNWPF
jgi:hypothetical protein